MKDLKFLILIIFLGIMIPGAVVYGILLISHSIGSNYGDGIGFIFFIAISILVLILIRIYKLKQNQNN